MSDAAGCVQKMWSNTENRRSHARANTSKNGRMLEYRQDECLEPTSLRATQEGWASLQGPDGSSSRPGERPGAGRPPDCAS
jgi:hypothetical protein